jgi:putative component of membrane protein insertase Oxa1/YidC/SpoIIIJ protein YidD
MLDATAVAAIGAYRRYLSPRKGFCCAYRTVTGRRSCSAYALAIVQRVGAVALLQALPRQFARCKAAYAQWLSRSDTGAQRQQPGKDERRRWWENCDCCSCDLPCDCALPCDCSL